MVHIFILNTHRHFYHVDLLFVFSFFNLVYPLLISFITNALENITILNLDCDKMACDRVFTHSFTHSGNTDI